LLTWKRADGWKTLRYLMWSAFAAVAAALVILVLTQRGPWLAPVALALGAWLVFGALRELALRVGWPQASFSVALHRLKALPRNMLGTTLAHGGLGLLLMAVIILSVWKVEKIASVPIGGDLDVAGYSVKFLGVKETTGPNYAGLAGSFRITRDNTEIATVISEKRIFQPSRIPTTEVGLVQGLAGDIYIVLGDKAPDGSYAVRASYNPLASWIWLGAAVMFLGGIMSLTDRRLRIGVPKRPPERLISAHST
jgi:cytochrome c-type biogenesis protein CcmF